MLLLLMLVAGFHRGSGAHFASDYWIPKDIVWRDSLPEPYLSYRLDLDRRGRAMLPDSVRKILDSVRWHQRRPTRKVAVDTVLTFREDWTFRLENAILNLDTEDSSITESPTYVVPDKVAGLWSYGDPLVETYAFATASSTHLPIPWTMRVDYALFLKESDTIVIIIFNGRAYIPAPKRFSAYAEF